jgi:hypothetical protein
MTWFDVKFPRRVASVAAALIVSHVAKYNRFPCLIVVGPLAENLPNDQITCSVPMKTLRHLGRECKEGNIAKFDYK